MSISTTAGLRPRPFKRNDDETAARRRRRQVRGFRVEVIDRHLLAGGCEQASDHVPTAQAPPGRLLTGERPGERS